ncbi:MAG: NHL repeat-containing protein, partial [Candidatus Firestonebacteria bacterium]|nr:NHL repeat-containing protein [Candidatus Firestonebacteria bacterium]
VDYINSITLKESAEGGKHPDPTYVLVIEDKIYITDNDNHRVVVYDRNTLEFVLEWGKNGFREGEFRYPFMMATNGTNKLYVVDVINARVQAFTLRGEYMHTIGQFGIKEGTFFRPKGISLDNNKRIYITDLYTGVIQVFNEDGVLLALLGNEFGNTKKFNTPFGITIDSQNNLYLTEMFPNTVTVLKILE